MSGISRRAALIGGMTAAWALGASALLSGCQRNLQGKNTMKTDNYHGDWLGLGEVLLPVDVFKFALAPTEPKAYLYLQMPAIFSLAADFIVRGEVPRMLSSSASPANAAINVWMENRGGTPEEVFDRVSQWNDRKVVFLRRETIGGNSFLHGQTMQRGADDGTISLTTAEIDHRLDIYVLQLAPSLCLVIRASRQIGMNPEVKAKYERDAKDVRRNLPGYDNYERDFLDFEAKQQVQRNKFNPQLDAAVSVVLANVRVFKGNPLLLPPPKPGLGRYYLWNCALDYPLDKMVASGAALTVAVNFGAANRALWYFTDERAAKDKVPASIVDLDENVRQYIDGVWSDKQANSGFDKGFEEFKLNTVDVGGHKGWLNEFYLPANRTSDDSLTDRYYTHYLFANYAPGHQFKILAEMTKEQMAAFRSVPLRQNYLDNFLPLIQFTKQAG